MARNLFFNARISLIALLCALTAADSARAIIIQFNYQYDTQGFFDPEPRREALTAAAKVYEKFTDSLSAISPGTRYNEGTPQEFVDTWSGTFEHPGQAGQAMVTDLEISANTMVIYAGAKNLGGNTLGFGGPGGYTVNGIAGFVEAVSTRGEPNTTGASPTDFGRWGGGITFDTMTSGGQPRNWHTNLSTSPPGNAIDLYTVALHELGHLFGFATSSNPTSPLSFQTNWNEAGRQFTGAKVQEIYGGAAPTASDGSAHWHTSVTSLANGDSQIPIMGPNVPPGLRREFTVLDYAAMEDIGWEVPASVYETPLPGDYDGNGIVNGADYSRWRSHFWSTSNLSADGNGNNRVDLADYTIWRDHRGATSGSGIGAAVVPEPTSFLLVLAGGMSLFFAAFRRD